MRFQHHSAATNAIHSLQHGISRSLPQRSGRLMAPRRLITAATLLGFGLHLASCGGFVADHWPHWAGGTPADVPPRPGAPGYSEFIAHGQAAPETKQQPAATAQGAVQPVAATEA